MKRLSDYVVKILKKVMNDKGHPNPDYQDCEIDSREN